MKLFTKKRVVEAPRPEPTALELAWDVIHRNAWHGRSNGIAHVYDEALSMAMILRVRDLRGAQWSLVCWTELVPESTVLEIADLIVGIDRALVEFKALDKAATAARNRVKAIRDESVSAMLEAGVDEAVARAGMAACTITTGIDRVIAVAESVKVAAQRERDLVKLNAGLKAQIDEVSTDAIEHLDGILASVI